jgi:hypothetical protein
MTGFLTKQRYTYATVYVDQASGLSYTYLQKTASAAETLEGKLAFERYCLHRGVVVRGYHADNGIFKAREWVERSIPYLCRSWSTSYQWKSRAAHPRAAGDGTYNACPRQQTLASRD